MDDKDRMGEVPGAADALRPKRPGGERKDTAETDQRPDPANTISGDINPAGATTEASRGRDERAAGMIDDPIGEGDRPKRG